MTTRRGATGVAAFFDLDGTLIPGSANIPLAKAAFKAGFASKRELAVDLARNLSFMLMGASDDRSAQVRDRILRGVTGRPASEIEALADGFLEELVATITPTVEVVLAEHREAGHDLVLISASPTEVVQRFALASGMTYGVGTTAERDERGCYTGRLSGPFCYKEGKASIVRDLAASHGYDLAECFAYSDSASDLPLLQTVGHPVAVNPDHALRMLAAQGGWRVLETGKLRGGVETLRQGIRSAGRAPRRAWTGGRDRLRERRNVAEEPVAYPSVAEETSAWFS